MTKINQNKSQNDFMNNDELAHSFHLIELSCIHANFTVGTRNTGKCEKRMYSTTSFPDNCDQLFFDGALLESTGLGWH